MPLTAQLSAGAAAKSVSTKPTVLAVAGQTGRKGAANTEYEAARIREVTSHAVLYEMRGAVMRGDMLDRRLLENELAHVFGVIRGIVLASSLSLGDKRELLGKLAGIPIQLAPPANGDDAAAEDLNE
jgi:hypothetical protein